MKVRVCLKGGKIVTLTALQRFKEGYHFVFLSNGEPGRIVRTYFLEEEIAWMEVDESIASLEALRPPSQQQVHYIAEPKPDAPQVYVPPVMQERKLRSSLVGGMPVSETPEGVVGAGFMS